MDGFADALAANKTYIIYWIGAICTFAIFSILYRENALYRLFEHIFIGLAAGQIIYVTWSELLKPTWWEAMTIKGQWWWALALIPGLMFYFIYSQRHSWVARIIMGLFMGLSAGMIFQNFANNYIPMMRASFKPVLPVPGAPWSSMVNNIIFVAVLVTVMAYFFFSIDHKAPSVRKMATLGRWMLMFAFGAMFGATVMARMSLLIGRVDFMLTRWGPIVPMGIWIALGTIIVVAIIASRILRNRPPSNPESTNGDTQPTGQPVPGAEQS